MAESYAQLEGLWIQAGGDTSAAPLMAAIALAESSGNPQAINPTDNNGQQTSWGLWQISNGTHNQPVPNILDPLINAQQAVAKYKSQGLGAWGTYTSGAYKNYLQGNVPPNLTAAGAGASAGSTNTFNPLNTTDWATLIDNILNYIYMAGAIVFGGCIMAIGAIMLVMGDGPIDAIKTVSKVVP